MNKEKLANNSKKNNNTNNQSKETSKPKLFTFYDIINKNKKPNNNKSSNHKEANNCNDLNQSYQDIRELDTPQYYKPTEINIPEQEYITMPISSGFGGYTTTRRIQQPAKQNNAAPSKLNTQRKPVKLQPLYRVDTDDEILLSSRTSSQKNNNVRKIIIQKDDDDDEEEEQVVHVVHRPRALKQQQNTAAKNIVYVERSPSPSLPQIIYKTNGNSNQPQIIYTTSQKATPNIIYQSKPQQQQQAQIIYVQSEPQAQAQTVATAPQIQYVIQQQPQLVQPQLQYLQTSQPYIIQGADGQQYLVQNSLTDATIPQQVQTQTQPATTQYVITQPTTTETGTNIIYLNDPNAATNSTTTLPTNIIYK